MGDCYYFNLFVLLDTGFRFWSVSREADLERAWVRGRARSGGRGEEAGPVDGSELFF